MSPQFVPLFCPFCNQPLPALVGRALAFTEEGVDEFTCPECGEGVEIEEAMRQSIKNRLHLI